MEALLVELIIVLFGEVLGFVIERASKKNWDLNGRPFFAGMICFVFGGVFGLISLWIFPEAFTKEPSLRFAYLFVVPILVGGLMTLLGVWRARRGKMLVRLNSFVYATLFAFGIVLIRFLWAR